MKRRVVLEVDSEALQSGREGQHVGQDAVFGDLLASMLTGKTHPLGGIVDMEEAYGIKLVSNEEA